MPQFILDKQGAVHSTRHLPPKDIAWADLDAFTQGYIQAMFFTNECPGVSTDEFLTPAFQARMHEGQTDGCLPGDVGFSDLHCDTLVSIMQDCADFQRDNAALLEAAYQHGGTESLPYNAERAGMDFWYNTVGHGVGFWDRGLGEIGDALDEACDSTEINPYYDLDTGKVSI